MTKKQLRKHRQQKQQTNNQRLSKSNQESVELGIQQSKDREVVDLGDFSQYSEDENDI